MNATKTPAEYSFVQNPIVFVFTSDSDAMKTFTVTFAGKSFQLSSYPFQVDNIYKLSLDISDLLRNLLRPTYDATATHQVGLTDFVQEYQVTEATTNYSFTGKVIPGGLSKEYQKYLIKEGTDAFAFRFLNPLANFLFTTRTDSNVMTLSRKELACMFFLSPSADQISVLTDKGDKLILQTAVAGIPCMVNLPVWLESLPDSGSVNTVFFCANDIKVIKINIIDRFSEESYLLKFRNSLGAYEFLEVTGKGNRAPVAGDDNSYNVFDEDIQDFKKARPRVASTDVKTVETGYKSTEELYFIGDLLSSNAIWFIDDQRKQKCTVTSENYTHALKQVTPESITLKVTPVTTEFFFSPMIDINTIYQILATEEDEYILTNDNYMIGV